MFFVSSGGVGERRGWVAEEATPQRWSVSAERRLFVLGVAVSLASFEEKKEICLYLVWLISSICLLTYKCAKRKQTNKKKIIIFIVTDRGHHLCLQQHR